MTSIVTNIISTITSVFGAKYYVEQQLAQMQAHHLNRKLIEEKAGTPANVIIKKIFDEYEKAIHYNDWKWFRDNDNNLHVVPRQTALRKTGYTHRGIFPPLGEIGSILVQCDKVVGMDNTESFLALGKNFVEAYVSKLEYWVLTLEALLQDMAI